MLLLERITARSAGLRSRSGVPSHGVAEGARLRRFFPLKVVVLSGSEGRCRDRTTTSAGNGTAPPSLSARSDDSVAQIIIRRAKAFQSP